MNIVPYSQIIKQFGTGKQRNEIGYIHGGVHYDLNIHDISNRNLMLFCYSLVRNPNDFKIAVLRFNKEHDKSNYYYEVKSAIIEDVVNQIKFEYTLPDFPDFSTLKINGVEYNDNALLSFISTYVNSYYNHCHLYGAVDKTKSTSLDSVLEAAYSTVNIRG